MEQTQAVAPAPAQAQTPVHPVHQEQQDLETFTKIVQGMPDNDPDHPTDTSTPRGPEGEEAPEEKVSEEVVEFDEETPFFELDYKTESGVEKKKLSAKELREGYLAKQDYSRNIQKVKAQEAELNTKVQQAALATQQEYLQKLEMHKQLVIKSVAPELQNVDLNKLAMEDPAEAQRLFFRQIQVNQTLQAIEQEQRQAVEKLQHEQTVARARSVEKARETLKSDIAGWGEELYGKVLGSMVSDYGLSKEGVTQVAEAELIKVFHDAYQYRSLQKAKPEISKKVVTIPKVVKPGSAEKPNPAKEDTERSYDRLKKTGKGEDFVNWYLNKNKKGK